MVGTDISNSYLYLDELYPISIARPFARKVITPLAELDHSDPLDMYIAPSTRRIIHSLQPFPAMFEKKGLV